MTSDQVKWKMNALIKKYREVIDKMSGSGSSSKTEFRWFTQTDQIFGKKNDVTVANHTVTSSFKNVKKNASPGSSTAKSTPSSGESKKINSPLPSTSKASPTAGTNHSEAAVVVTPTSSGGNKKKKAPHGTGSTIARAKGELERQWIETLSQKNINDKFRNEKLNLLAEIRKESTKLKKKKHYAMKKREMELKREREETKARDKNSYFDSIIALEERRLKFIQNTSLGKENRAMFSDSE